ncbi:MAG: AbrB/MazE/SpoVT family DNA-binding domain-containing protein [Methanobrevibacter sp.]|nr:AbrB/MazE/SpoVT family DNA-binding domain-containing protein [Methanobrevibacter sp.]
MSKFISKTNYAASHSGSLRVTIPKEIVDKLELSKGDSVKWILTENEETNEISSVKVEKLDL